MFTRISNAVLICAALAACSSGPESPEPEGDTIECAVGPGAEYASVCTLEWSEQEGEADGRVFLIHDPAGGFRRVSLDPTTLELKATDGAGELLNLPSSVDGIFEFEVDGDRYRVPLSDLVSAPE